MRRITTALVLAGLALSGTARVEAQTAAQKGRSSADTRAEKSDPTSRRVVIAPEVVDGWNFMYRFITEVEFVLCLEGRREGSAVHVTGFRLARMESPTVNSVRYQPCDDETYVGTAHNHPPVDGGGTLCYSSVPDKRSFELDRRAVVDVILCGPDRYLWTLRDGTVGGPGNAAMP